MFLLCMRSEKGFVAKKQAIYVSVIQMGDLSFMLRSSSEAVGMAPNTKQ